MGGKHRVSLTTLGSASTDVFILQPYNYQYTWKNTSDNFILEDPTISILNTYTGGVYQQATSVVSKTSMYLPFSPRIVRPADFVSFANADQEAYELTGFQYATYGFQYKPGFGDAVSLNHTSPRCSSDIHSSTSLGSMTENSPGRSISQGWAPTPLQKSATGRSRKSPWCVCLLPQNDPDPNI